MKTRACLFRSGAAICQSVALVIVVLCLHTNLLAAESFDAAPFGMPLRDDKGLLWEDPREIHRVIVQFKAPVPEPDRVRLEYWGSWWPERHLPKDREPGGGDVGWMELGNWYKYGWRKADAKVTAAADNLTFEFHPVNAKEFPKVKDYAAPFRYTLKIRITSDDPLPDIEKFQALTDSMTDTRAVRVVWENAAPPRPEVNVFNGALDRVEPLSAQALRLHLKVTSNRDPNTFDRTLVTVRSGQTVFTFKVDDLAEGHRK